MKTLVLAGIAGAILAAAPVHAETGRAELGMFGGAHIFSDDLELGVYDLDPTATSPQNGFTFGARLSFDLIPRLALEGELAVIPTSTRRSSDDVTVFAGRAHALFHLATGKVRPFVLAGFGVHAANADSREMFTDIDPAAHGGAGVKFAVNDRWGVRLDARVYLPPKTDSSSVTTDFEALLGVYGAFDKPAPKKVEPPPPPPDEDGDGITDADDKCPKEAEDKDSFLDEDGCADPDNDGDTIADAADQCPNEAETKNGISDDDGCPEKDDDGDGLVGDADKCPTDAEDKDGFQDEDGCPDPDNDADGIADADDKCNGQPETKNGYQDGDGCPDEVPITVQKFVGVIQGITFDTGKATIKKSSNKTLDAAAKVLTDVPDVKLEIQGHTDDVGDHDANVKLSQERAEAVKAYFESKGIAADRLKAIGYGPDKPIDPATTAKARAKNRRVEFQLLQ